MIKYIRDLILVAIGWTSINIGFVLFLEAVCGK